MRDWLYRHRFGATLAVGLLMPLLMMYYHGRRGAGASLVERVSVGIAGSAQGVVGGVVGFVADGLKDYVFLVGVEDDNRRLQAENERLVGEALQAKKLAVENQNLRKLLELRDRRRDLKLVPARVIGREVTPFYRVSRLALESDGAVSPDRDMAVITPEGLLGRVVQATGRYADVMLLSDNRSRVACEVLGRGTLGMLAGTGTPDEYQARLQVSITDPALEKGAVIVTSGHDRVFPHGIEVGYVGDPSRKRQAGAFVEYDVILAVNPATVQEAMVVVDSGVAREK